MEHSSKRRVGRLWLLLGGLTAGCPFEAPPVLSPYGPLVLPDLSDAGTPDRPPEPTRPTPPRSQPGAFSMSLPFTQTPAVPPPAISGGTLLVARDGRTAVAADPDRDRVCFADVAAGTSLGCVALAPGDEPGRLVEDEAGRVHVALRRGGALVTIDVATRELISRRPVCPAPRGVAYDPATRLLHVACVDGDLVSFPVGGSVETRRLHLEQDLRDVVVQGSQLVVSEFRSAVLLTLDADGNVVRRVRPANVSETAVGRGFRVGGQSGVAWRTLATPGGVLVLHQRSLTNTVSVEPGGYGGGNSSCQTGVVQGSLTLIGATAPFGTPTLSGAALAVDVAVSADGRRMAVAMPGNSVLRGASQVISYGADAVGATEPGACANGQAGPPLEGQVVAVAMTPDDVLVTQTREPSTLVVERGAVIRFGGGGRGDTGHLLFHSNAGAFVACASCHPEGGDDGRVWNFSPVGARRTQNLQGGLAGTAPFHWDGDMPTFARLASEVFAQRMSGGELRTDQVDALERYTTTQPAIPKSPPRDAGAVARGQAIFEEPFVGCAACHNGERFTNNGTVDVGTGAAFQVPSLRGVAWRTPLMHNGCAPTLRDRFGDCGGGDRHGHTSQLAPAQISDLVAYLETL